MKKLLFLAALYSAGANAQIYTTTGSGNFFNPLLWDCFCVPANGDSLVINHAMIMSASIYYNTGQIKINSAGSLMEDGSDRDVWVDGTGSLINNGTFDCYRLYVSDGLFINNSNSVYFDSLWNQGNIANTGNMTVYDILNDQAGTFTNSGTFIIENNFNNQGEFLNQTGGTIDLTNDFSNCNIQTMDAMFINDGIFCIGQDFTNCLDDTLSGTGSWHIGNSSSNFGVFDATFAFNTPTGNLGFNSGTLDPGVNFGNAPCGLTLEEEDGAISLYPNPAYHVLMTDQVNLPYIIFDLSGKIILSGQTASSGIDVSSLASGIYQIQLVTENGAVVLRKFVKH